jgi:hypothetical protein
MKSSDDCNNEALTVLIPLKTTFDPRTLFSEYCLLWRSGFYSEKPNRAQHRLPQNKRYEKPVTEKRLWW